MITVDIKASVGLTPVTRVLVLLAGAGPELLATCPLRERSKFARFLGRAVVLQPAAQCDFEVAVRGLSGQVGHAAGAIHLRVRSRNVVKTTTILLRSGMREQILDFSFAYQTLDHKR